MIYENEENPTRVSQPQGNPGRANSAGIGSEQTPFDSQFNEVRNRNGVNSGHYVPPSVQTNEADKDTRVGGQHNDKTQVIRPEPEPGLAGFLYLRRGARRGQLIQLRQERSEFGRATDGDIFIEDKAASAHHGAIRYDGKTWRITDFDSTNGTFVNGEKLGTGAPNPCELKDNDSIVIGDTEFVFKFVAD